MPTPLWRHPASLIQRLLDQPQQFNFFQSVSIIERWLRRNGQAQGVEHWVRFTNSVSLSFPASAIEALHIDADGPVRTASELQAALARGQLRRIHITPTFMGFLGVNGVLPYHYTDTVAGQLHAAKDAGPRAFLDLFSHRCLTLFYRAWQQCRVEYRTGANGGDGFMPLQLALAGVAPGGNTHQQENDARSEDDGFLSDEVRAHYAALIRHRPVSSAVLTGVLTEYFGLPFALEQFVGKWETQLPHEQSRLGVANFTLNHDTMLGPRYLRHDLWVRLRIGPLTRADFDRFMPGTPASEALRAMLTLFAVPNLRFEVRPVLRQQDMRPVVLGSGAALSRGAFLLTRPAQADHDQACYHIIF